MSSSEDRKNTRPDPDDFWDISKLIPAKKKPISRAPTDVSLTEITVEGRARAQSDPAQTRLTEAAPASRESAVKQESVPAREESETVITRFIPQSGVTEPKQPQVPDDEYVPQSAMLHRVRIYRWKTSYQYYEDFCKHATVLYRRRGEPCAPVAFFSYVPQYSQMNRAQLNWYLYWREGVRRGEILPTDYSYILLYIFEIINLADTMDVQVGRQQLCALRDAFRTTYPRLGHLLNEWICDYSLIHHLPPPQTDDLTAMADCTLKEFYVPSTDASLRYASALIAFGSNYVYTKSKFAAGENRALYDRHMPGALRACIADSGEVGARMAGAGLEESRLIRDSYTGALCSHRVKRRIEVDYCSFARSHELRILVTDIMKYTENRLRAYLGVKSRLGLYALPQSFRDCVDRYLRDALPHRERITKVEPRQEYEALYDLPRTTLDPERAARIEASSWDTTEKLIAAFEDPGQSTAALPCDDIPIAPAGPCPSMAVETAVEMPKSENTSEKNSLQKELSEFVGFINCALCGDVKGQKEFARARGEMTDSIVDRINEIAADAIGDVFLEEDENGGYRVIEDYIELWETGE